VAVIISAAPHINYDAGATWTPSSIRIIIQLSGGVLTGGGMQVESNCSQGNCHVRKSTAAARRSVAVLRLNILARLSTNSRAITPAC
jgi:hypothetical protein